MSTTSTNNNVRSMLKAGVLVGPLFIGLSLILALASPGFDITKHEVSVLLGGNLGWLQMLNFILVGLLSIIYAVGLKRALKSGRASKWGPILMAAFGVLFIVAALFHPDGHHGFPSGSPAGMIEPPTASAGIHSMAFSFLALATVINGFVFARRYFAEKRAWAFYNILNSVLIIVLIGIGGSLMPSGQGGLPLLAVATAISFWVTATALYTLRNTQE